MKIIKLINISLFIFFISCSAKNITIEQDIQIKYDKGVEFFNKKKYSRSAEEFKFIIMNDPGSEIARNSQYFLGESLYLQEEFIDAAIAFDQFARFPTNKFSIESARFRVCECTFKSSRKFNQDQSNSLDAIDQLQYFIEDFPLSEKIEKANDMINKLRSKIAQKDFETGRLYLKLEEYDAAIIYFQQVLNKYYDTSYADEARISIIFTHLLNNNMYGAETYYKTEKTRFQSEQKIKEAELLLDNKNRKIKMSELVRLYK